MIGGHVAGSVGGALPGAGGPAAGVPPEFVAATSTSGFNVGSLTINKPAGVANGDILIAIAYSEGGEDFATPAGWTLVYRSNTGPEEAVFAKLASSEPASYTFTLSVAQCQLSLLAYRPSSPVNYPAGFIHTVGTAIPSVPSVQSNRLIVAIFSTSGPASVTTPPSGMVSRVSQSDGVGAHFIFDGTFTGDSGTKSATLTGATSPTNLVFRLG